MVRKCLLSLSAVLGLAASPAATADEVGTLRLFGIVVSTTIADGAAPGASGTGNGRQVIGGVHGDAEISGTVVDLTHAPDARSFGFGGRACQVIGGITGGDPCGEAKPKPRD